MSEHAESLHDPSLEDVIQDEQYDDTRMPVVDVRHVGPITSHSLPNVLWISRSIAITQQSQQVLANEPRRRRALLLSAGNFYVGPSANEADSQYAADWLASIPLTLEHTREVWVRSEAASAFLQLIAEYWTD